MSTFDFPRINFHGKAFLDTSTANNGNYEGNGLTMFDQNESEPFMPPRCYLNKNVYVPPAGSGIVIATDKNGNAYVPITPINKDNYEAWAQTRLGSFEADAAYQSLYTELGLTGSNPGYWNYFGDLSMSLQDVKVTGITVPDVEKGSKVCTPEDVNGCPPYLAEMFGAELSFNSNYFSPGSRTSAYLCDVDAIGQMCTQIFCGEAGLYKKGAQNEQITFFKDKPVKSTHRWMNLTKSLNYSDMSLLPMGGSASFYTMLELDENSELSAVILEQTGKQAKGLCIKMLVHQVYEVRNPDYNGLPKTSFYDLQGNQAEVPKNPATVAVSGSITPWFEGDLKTTSIARIMKLDTEVSINTSNIPVPVTRGGKTLSVPNTIYPGPVQFWPQHDANLISFDLINLINEYGTNPGVIAPYAGQDDVPAYQEFEAYDFGTITVMFKEDVTGIESMVGEIYFDCNYNMQHLLANGGVVDLVPKVQLDFSQGSFYLKLAGGTILSSEDDHLITSDQMGNYAQQNQEGYNYMSDGLPKGPCVLNVYRRGIPVEQNNPLSVTMQAIDFRTGSVSNTDGFEIYNGKQLDLPSNINGCMTYGFIDGQSKAYSGGLPIPYAMNTSLIVLRTLEDNLDLQPYLSGEVPITWPVVYKHVFGLFNALYPVMNAILPFTEENWSDSFILRKLLMLVDESNWNQPLYMPVTRDLSEQQVKLLTMWANQVLQTKQN